jgi:8-oxo-dGTP diphosphatase
MSIESFPMVPWDKDNATFVTTLTPAAAESFAALVFPFYGDRIVLAEIAGRGWCIPSGRLEPNETAEEAVRREAYEEAGITFGRVVPLGCFVLTDANHNQRTRYAPAFVGEVIGLGEIPEGSESLGRMLVAVEEVSELYYAWDALLASVFEKANEAKATLLLSGLSLNELRSS